MAINRFRRARASAALAAGVLILGAPAALGAGPGPAMEAPASRPSSAAIRTPDLDRAVAWYRDKLGFRPLARRAYVAGSVAVLERDGFLLELREAPADVPQLPALDPDSTAALGGPALTLLVKDVDSEVRRLRERGVEILAEPEDDLSGRFRSAVIRDDQDHSIELMEPLSLDPSVVHPEER
jgi:catechol 2,3-dioxygenase-like lactoylglutathione lyase family enzyme